MFMEMMIMMMMITMKTKITMKKRQGGPLIG